MTFNSLKQTINRNLDAQQFITFDETTNKVNKILTGILTLNHIRQLISYNSKYNTDTGAVAKEYVSTYKNVAESLKNKYISYKMISFDETERLIGHAVGGVCPFGINENVKVYLDVSLKKFETIFPACGSSNSAIELTTKDLEKLSQNFVSWVDVCKNIN